MRCAKQRHAIAASRSIVGRAGIEHVRRIEFLGLLEALHQAIVVWPEFRLVEIVVDRLARNSVAKADLKVLGIVEEPLAGGIVERSRTTFRLELRKAQITH